MLIWTTEAIINLIACIPVVVSIWSLGSEYLHTKNRQLLILIAGWVSMFFYMLLEAISYIIQSKALYQFRSITTIGIGISVILWLDSINRDAIDPIKLSIFTFLSGFAGWFLFQPNAILDYTFPNGEPSYQVAQQYVPMVIIITVFPGVLWIYFTIKVFVNSPIYLKKYAMLFLISSLFIIAIPIVVVAIRFTLLLPGIDAFFMGIGALMMTIVFLKTPQLGYVLPFKAVKVAVLGSNNNILLYLHKWASLPVDSKTQPPITPELEDEMFSGMINGINFFIKETIQRGEVREITTDQAVLLVHHHEQHPVMFVLLSTKSTRSLRNAFRFFVKEFVQEYSQYFYQPYKKSYYETGSKLIDKCFPFIPYYVPPEKFVIDKKGPSNDTEIGSSVKICVTCKDVRDLNGNWYKMEKYIQSVSEGQINWEICPTCQKYQHVLLLSYFDQAVGPQILMYFPGENLDPILKKVPFFLEMQNQSYFLYTIGDHVLANQRFTIPAPKMRGKEINFLLSYTNLHKELNEKFARRFLKEISISIRSLSDLDNIFDFKRGPERKSSPEYQVLYGLLERYYRLIPQKSIEYYLLDEK
jgi:hypothetical protein